MEPFSAKNDGFFIRGSRIKIFAQLKAAIHEIEAFCFFSLGGRVSSGLRLSKRFTANEK